VEALQTDNGWLEYRLRAVEDALLGQRTLTVEGTTAVDKVKVVLLEKEEVLATTICRRSALPWLRRRPHWRRKRPLLSRRRPSSSKVAPPSRGRGPGRLRRSRRPRRPRNWVLTYTRRSRRSPRWRSSFAKSGVRVSKWRASSMLMVDFGTPSYEFTVNICTYLIFELLVLTPWRYQVHSCISILNFRDNFIKHFKRRS
jgi:hypothetical protein